MYILDKILGALKLSFLNRQNSSSVKAGGNISAGRDIIVGDQNISQKSQRVGLLEEGKNNTYINCEMEGSDYGMIDRGKNTTIIDSKIKSTKNK